MRKPVTEQTELSQCFKFEQLKVELKNTEKWESEAGFGKESMCHFGAVEFEMSEEKHLAGNVQHLLTRA